MKFTPDYEKAMEIDLGRAHFDSKLEVGLILDNIENTLNKVSTWAKDIDIDSSLTCAPSRNRIHYDPLGVVLVISAWNYPIFTMFEPIVSAIAAGNVCLLKPSEVSPSSSVVI